MIFKRLKEFFQPFIYASNDENAMLAWAFEEYRDDLRNSRSVFLMVYASNDETLLRMDGRYMKRILGSILLLSVLLITACGKKEPEALEVEIYPQADYWAVLDLSETAFPTEEACEELVERYLIEIADLLHMEV